MRYFKMVIFGVFLLQLTCAQAATVSGLQVSLITPAQVNLGSVFNCVVTVAASSSGKMQVKTIFDSSKLQLISTSNIKSIPTFSGKQNVTFMFKAISSGSATIGAFAQLQIGSMVDKAGKRVVVQVK